MAGFVQGAQTNPVDSWKHVTSCYKPATTHGHIWSRSGTQWDKLHAYISSKIVLCCRDAVVLQHSYEIFSRSIELSVHDNVLLVHHLDSSTVLLLDVRARSNGPIAGPLPLAIALDDQVNSMMLLLAFCCNPAHTCSLITFSTHFNTTMKTTSPSRM